MALPSSSAHESGSRHHAYSRKQKSLGLLCSNFLSLYNRDGIESIGLDDAATKLGVERRRIYDIVNVLESVGVLARKAKNRYSWKGFRGIPNALSELKEEGLKENFSTFDGNNDVKVSDDDDDERSSNPNTGSQNEKSLSGSGLKSSASSKSDSHRREKSLGLLTQNFVKLFLCSDERLISLDEAAKILLGDGHNSTIMRNNSAAKVRRLYDIANVLSSMNLIEKTHHPENRKPAFRWLGMRGRGENASASVSGLNEPKKRAFGTEITNTNFKRNKQDPLIDGTLNQTKNIQLEKHMKEESFEFEVERSNSEQESKQYLKHYQFGPFAPVNVPKVVASDNNIKKVHDWENLASTYRPQYHNQALRDLFAHYMEAWQSWYSEVAGKPVQQIS